MTRTHLAFVPILLIAAAWPSSAQAQEGNAESLYNEGVSLMKDNHAPEACPKLEKSNKLEPGVGVMLWLANCYEKVGKTASAFRQYIAAEQLAVQTKDNRDKVAHKRASELEPKLSKLIIALPAGGHVDGLEVRRDGDIVKNFGESMTVDPGTHIVEATAPGYKHWESKVDVATDGAAITFAVGPLEKEEVAVVEKPLPPPPPSAGWSPVKITGLVIAGAGVVGLGIGGAFGFLAKGSLDDSNANNHCDASNHCDPQGLALRSDAQSSALLSTISFIGGGVLVAGGLVMFFLAPKPAQEAAAPASAKANSVTILPTLAPSFAGMSAVGRF